MFSSASLILLAGALSMSPGTNADSIYRDELRREQAVRAADAEQARFVALINDFRRQHGLGELAHSDRLAELAQRNNRAGGGHKYVPAGCGQNWCMHSSGMNAERAFAMWRVSSGHNANMRGAWSVCGLAIDGVQATLNLGRGDEVVRQMPSSVGQSGTVRGTASRWRTQPRFFGRRR